MDERYRMLGKEHEADLERDAEKWRLAAAARGHGRASRVAPKVDRGKLARELKAFTNQLPYVDHRIGDRYKRTGLK